MTPSPRPQLIANATVAQYIHEISVRHRPRDQEARRWRSSRPGAREAAAHRARRRLTVLEGEPRPAA